MPGGARISFNNVDSSLSSLKNCQSYINTGMDIATHVALDLVESFNDVEDVNSMEKVMIEYAAMDRELNHYMRAIEETVNQEYKDQAHAFTIKALKSCLLQMHSRRIF